MNLILTNTTIKLIFVVMNVEYKDTKKLTNDEIWELVEEYYLVDEIVDILVENGDYVVDDDLSKHEHALDIARDLIESL